MVDREARKRTTSVYLVHRVIPMLPRLLCENFCSLNPGCERLTFSLWVKLSKRGEIMSIPRISRSIIKSCARFTYEQAQDIIDGKVSSQKDLEEGFGCVDSGDFEAVAKDIKNMHKLAAELRRKRV
jgi:exoribonuclease R